MNTQLKTISLTAIALCGILSAAAQSTGELLRFSRYDFSTSTARSAAMAGAYTSLGSDLSSMSINPAGLAMYSSNEVAVTAGLNIGATSSNYGGNNSTLASGVKFMIPNFGAAIKLGDFTLGVGMNRLADFNSRMSIQGDFELYNSASRIWADQITGIPASQFGKVSTMFDRNPLLWNGVMGYDGYMINPATDSPNNTVYGVWNVVDPTDLIRSAIDVNTDGAINEFTISGAYDFNKILYVGLTMGFQSITYQQSSVYREFNDLNNPKLSGVLDDLSLSNTLKMTGFGFNIKVGATVRPVPWLRVGVAYHSPTWSSIEEVSYSTLSPKLSDGICRDSYTPDLLQNYNFQTPGRLMAGISATIARRVLVSFDYELTSFDNMFYNTPINLYGWRENVVAGDIDNIPNYVAHKSSTGNIDINAVVRENYRSTNNYRVGVEVQPVDRFFLRVGFGYSESPYSDKIESLYAPGTKLSDYGAITRYSGGVGYRTGKFNIDLAYVYSAWSELPSKFFDYITAHSYDTGGDGTIAAGTNIASKKNINSIRQHHNVSVTFSWRF